MSNIQIFNFQDNSQTPVKILIQDNKEYFLAKNVCNILELSNVSQALSRLEKDDIISNDTLTTGGMQKMSYVSEAGLYELVFASKKPEAKEFKKWVFNKILPTIRKTGKFEVQQRPQIDSKFLLQIAQQMAEKEKLIELQSEKIEVLQIENTKQVDENQKLKITIIDFFKGAELFTRRQVCHFLARQGLEIKEQQITDYLNQKKWLCKGEYNSNKATAESCRIGWFVNDISVYEVNGRKKTSEYGKFTVEGLVGIYDTFKKPAELNK